MGAVQNGQPNPHAQPPYHPDWGPPPPPSGYGYGYGPPMKDPRVKELDDQSLVWLIVGAAGFWIGASFITGPLAWIFGSKMREKYRALGLQPGGAATGAFIIGIVTTVLTVLAFLAIAMMIVLFAGFLAIPVTH